jgi:hypothetical protein
MGFLKKLGKIILEGSKFLPHVGPIIKAYTPDKVDKIIDRVTDKSREMADVVITAEAVGQALALNGPDKLKASVPLMTQVILRSDILIGRKIDNPVLFTEGVQDLCNGWVKILNSLKDDVDG